MEACFLPVLSHFQNANAWTGSGGRLRYQLVPEGEEINAQVWEGPFCLELSTVEEARAFPLSEAGLEDLRSWLAGWEETVNSRPPRSLAETLELRAKAAPAAGGEG